jgi:hypothetical protein
MENGSHGFHHVYHTEGSAAHTLLHENPKSNRELLSSNEIIEKNNYNHSDKADISNIRLTKSVYRKLVKRKNLDNKSLYRTSCLIRNSHKSKLLRNMNIPNTQEMKPLLEASEAIILNTKKGVEDKVNVMGKLLMVALEGIRNERLNKTIMNWSIKSQNKETTNELKRLLDEKLDFNSKTLLNRKNQIRHQSVVRVFPEKILNSQNVVSQPLYDQTDIEIKTETDASREQKEDNKQVTLEIEQNEGMETFFKDSFLQLDIADTYFQMRQFNER